MLGYTNLESERGFDFFQKFMKENGVIERLTEWESKKETLYVCIIWSLTTIDRYN